MKLGYNDVKPGRVYRITGNTRENAGRLRKIGATYHDDAPDHDAGGPTQHDRYWILDLSGTSKSAYQRMAQNEVFHLVRGGCDFERITEAE